MGAASNGKHDDEGFGFDEGFHGILRVIIITTTTVMMLTMMMMMIMMNDMAKLRSPGILRSTRSRNRPDIP